MAILVLALRRVVGTLTSVPDHPGLERAGIEPRHLHCHAWLVPEVRVVTRRAVGWLS